MGRDHRGYATVVSDARLWERDTVSCGHCAAVIFVKPGTASTTYLLPHRDGRWTEEPGAFCRVCMRPVCLRCHAHGACLPLERWLSQQEARRVSPASVSAVG